MRYAIFFVILSLFAVYLVGDGQAQQAQILELEYNGGPVMSSGINVYLIFYGAEWTTRDKTIVTQFINGLSGSSYFNINTIYYDDPIPSWTPPNQRNRKQRPHPLNQHVKNVVTLAGMYDDNLSRGAVIHNSDVVAILEAAFQSKQFVVDPQRGAYIILGSPDVTGAGFCTDSCGWHNFGYYGEVNSRHTIKYAYVGNPAQCPGLCSYLTDQSAPNGSLGADSMVSIIAHELNEISTDPEIDGWQDALQQESSDKCAWTFGTPQITAGGQKYNLTFNTGNYYIQQNWVNGFGCAMKLPY